MSCLSHLRYILYRQPLEIAGQDLDGVRPLYVKRFGAAARTLPALQTLVWNPTAEVEWTWTYFRDGERIKFKENAVITYSKGPKGDEPERAVVMNPPLSSD